MVESKALSLRSLSRGVQIIACGVSERQHKHQVGKDGFAQKGRKKKNQQGNMQMM